MRPIVVQEEDIFDGFTHGQTPPLITHSNRPDLVSLTSIEKFTEENFLVWKFKMSILLCARKLLGIMDGTILRESFTDEEDWLDKDATCQSFLIFAIDSKLLCRLMNCLTAHQMWRHLYTIHEQNATKIVQMLQQQFFDMKMKPDAEVVDHISCVEQLANQLNDLGKTISDQAVICKILSKLLPHFHHLYTTWNSVPRHE